MIRVLRACFSLALHILAAAVSASVLGISAGLAMPPHTAPGFRIVIGVAVAAVMAAVAVAAYEPATTSTPELSREDGPHAEH